VTDTASSQEDPAEVEDEAITAFASSLADLLIDTIKKIEPSSDRLGSVIERLSNELRKASEEVHLAVGR